MENVTAAAERAEIALNNNIGAGDFFLTIVLYFLVFAVIIGGFIFFRKYMLNRIAGVRSGSSMKIKGRKNISSRII